MEVNSGIPRGGTCEILDEPLKDAEEKPLPLRSLFTRPVLISVANYGMIGLLEMTVTTLLPLIWSTSVEFGGLGMSPVSIGLWMGVYGTLNGALQFIVFPRIVGRFGPRRIFIASIVSFVPVYLIFPCENLTLRHASSGANALWVLILLQLASLSVTDMGFSKCSPVLCLCTILRTSGTHKAQCSCM
jgi:MFS family permease